MEWTKEEPTKHGWYFWRAGPKCFKVAVYVDEDDHGRLVCNGYYVDDQCGEWSPIDEPE